MRTSIFVVGALTLLLGACGGIKVTTDFDVATDFSDYETFAWMEGSGGGDDPRVSGQLMDQRFRRAIESELVARGMQKTTSGPPDLLVGYQVALNDEIDYQTINTYWGRGWGYSRVGRGVVVGSTTVREYTVGTLIIDVFDASRRELIWRGAGEGRVEAASNPQERQERVNEAVYAIMEEFPVG